MAERKFGLVAKCFNSCPGESGFAFSAYDMALLYNCKLLKSSINKLCNCTFDHIDIIKRVLRDFIVDPYILDYIIFNCDDDFFQTCIRGSYFGYKDRDGKIKSDRIFFGFSPELLCRDVVYKKNPVENYLYGVAVKKDVVNMKLLHDNDVDYCEDNGGWIYFAVDNVSLESDDLAVSCNFDDLPEDDSVRDCSSGDGYGPNGAGCGSDRACVAASFDLERNLDICHSLITLHKMEVLISVAGPKIVDCLNNANLGVEFELGCSYNYIFSDSKRKIYCGDFIHIVGMPESIYFGLSPNVFDEEDEIRGEAGILKSRNPKNVIVSDYFSSVSMVIMNGFCAGTGFRAGTGTGAGAGFGAGNGDSVGSASRDGAGNVAEKYINNGVEFAGNWVYFPVCRKLLCCNNFEELYINRIVKLVGEGYLKYIS